MTKSGISLENVKINNKAAILEILNKKGEMPRKDIAAELKLTPAAVTLLCTELLEDGILLEKGEMQEEKRAGRRKVLIDINYDYKYIVAVNIETMNTYVTITNLKGHRISQRSLNTDSAMEPEEFLRRIASECKALLWECEKNSSQVLGMGICLPGIVNRKEGISEDTYSIWRRAVPVKKIMETYMNCPVIVENNIKAFAEGELLYGMGKTEENLLFLKWGPGVGSAMVIGNQVYEGAGRKAAEIGHYILESGQKKCLCGRTGCLETEVSITAVTEKLKAVYSKESTPELYRATHGDIQALTGEFVYEMVENTSKEYSIRNTDAAARVFDECIAAMARVFVNVLTVMAPDRAILFGCMLENDKIRKRFLEICRFYDKRYDENYMAKSVLSKQITYIGAATLVAREYFFNFGYSD